MKTSRLFSLLMVSAFIFPSFVWAAIHYVSPTGSATWANAVYISTPCSTGVAFTNANAGDTVYFRGGTYTVPAKNSGDWMTGYYNVAHAGTSGNPIVFMAYPGEVPLFNGTSGGSGDKDGQGYYGYATIFSTYYNSYITFDGFSFQADNGASQARIVVTGGDNASTTRTTGCIVKNCVLFGGAIISPSGDNHEGIFVSQTRYLVIGKCKIYSYHQSANNHNTSGIKTYHCDHVSVENCEIYDCVVAIFYKSDMDNSSIGYNFLHDNNAGILVTPDIHPVMDSDSLSIYQNVMPNNLAGGIIETGEGSDSGTHGDDFMIYNNTLYGNGGYGNTVMGYSDTGGHGLSYYNNIDMMGKSGSLVTIDRSNWRSFLKAADHNQWGTTFKTIKIGFNNRNIYYATLSGWQSSGQLENAIDVGCGSSSNPGCGDLASDPLFANGSGKLNQLGDFTLASTSPCKGAGRNGVDDIGAAVSLIGLSGQAGIKEERAVPNASNNLKTDIRISNVRAAEIDFEITVGRAGDYRVSVFDISGREVWKKNLKFYARHRKIAWVSSGIGNGTYVVVLNQNNQQTARAFAVVW